MNKQNKKKPIRYDFTAFSVLVKFPVLAPALALAYDLNSVPVSVPALACVLVSAHAVNI